MDWATFLSEIANVCLIPLLGVAVSYFVKWVELKRDEMIEKSKNDTADKYISMVSETITSCVIATKQTYVDSLKAQGVFDEEAQKEAFRRTLEAVESILSDEVKKYLNEAYTDVSKYLATKIEAEVQLNKPAK